MLGAIALLALTCVQVGRLTSRGSSAPVDAAARSALILPASMDVVSQVGEFTTLTFNAGSDDVLAVLDGRGEQLFLYRVRNQREIEFISRDDLKNIFAAARRLGPGRQ